MKRDEQRWRLIAKMRSSGSTVREIAEELGMLADRVRVILDSIHDTRDDWPPEASLTDAIEAWLSELSVTQGVPLVSVNRMGTFKRKTWGRM